MPMPASMLCSSVPGSRRSLLAPWCELRWWCFRTRWSTRRLTRRLTMWPRRLSKGAKDKGCWICIDYRGWGILISFSSLRILDIWFNHNPVRLGSCHGIAMLLQMSGGSIFIQFFQIVWLVFWGGRNHSLGPPNTCPGQLLSYNQKIDILIFIWGQCCVMPMRMMVSSFLCSVELTRWNLCSMLPLKVGTLLPKGSFLDPTFVVTIVLYTPIPEGCEKHMRFQNHDIV